MRRVAVLFLTGCILYGNASLHLSFDFPRLEYRECPWESLSYSSTPSSHWGDKDKSIWPATRTVYNIHLKPESMFLKDSFRPEVVLNCTNGLFSVESSIRLAEMHSHSAALNNFVFHLIDGSNLTGKDIRDIPHLISLLPLIKEIYSEQFISWMEAMDHDMRRRILQTVEYVPMVGGSEDLVVELYHFKNIEASIEKMNGILLRVKSGEMIHQLTTKANFFNNEVRLSRKLVRGSIRQFVKAYMENQTVVDISNYNSSVQELGVDGIDFWGNEKMFDLIVGISEGDIEEVMKALMLLFESFTGMPFEDALNFFDVIAETGRRALISNLISLIPGTERIGITFAVSGMMNDISSILDGSVNSLALASSIVSLVANVLSIVITIGSMLAFQTLGLSLVVAAIAAVINVILTAVSVILDVFSKKQQTREYINSLDSQINLTAEEKKREEERFKAGLPPSEYLTDLISQRWANEQLVSIAFEFLAQNTDFDKYVFPAIESVNPPKFYLNNEALMNEPKIRRNVERWIPFGEINVVCDPKLGPIASDLYECAPIYTTGLINGGRRNGRPCKRAFGINYNMGRTDYLTLIDLKDGNDIAIGSIDATNIFIVESGIKNYKGGNRNDVFIIKSVVNGEMDGLAGNNTISLSKDIFNPVKVNLLNNVIHFGQETVTIKNVQTVLGQEAGQDEITPACDTIAVVPLGGINYPSNADLVTVSPLPECEYQLIIQGSSYTKVENEGISGIFFYNVPSSAIDFIVSIKHEKTATHVVRLEYPIQGIKGVKLNTNEELIIESTDGGRSSFTMAALDVDQIYYSNPTFLTDNGGTIRVDKFGVVTFVYQIINPTTSLEAIHIGQSAFFIQEYAQILKGWEGNDTFILESEFFTGTIYGEGGLNQIVLGEGFYPDSIVTFFPSGSVSIGGSKVFGFQNVTQFSGRSNGTEIFICQCDTSSVNTQGGFPDILLRDKVIIPFDDNCNYSLTVRLGQNSDLDNKATVGHFIYSLPFAENVTMNILSASNLSHVVRFEFPAKWIKNGTLVSNTEFEIVNVTGNTIMQFPIELPTANDDDKTEVEYFAGPIYITGDFNPAVVQIDLNGDFHFIFDISRGSELVEGSLFGQNVFLIKNHTMMILGGDSDDIFVLSQTDFIGTLDGGNGLNVLILNQNYTQGAAEVVQIDLSELSNGQSLLLLNINQVIGRQSSPDRFIVSCKTALIDGLEGINGFSDVIEIPPGSQNCEYDIRIVIRNYTQVDNMAAEGKMTYDIVDSQGNFDFITGNSPKLKHVVLFPLHQENLTYISFNQNSSELQFNTVWNTSLEFKLADIDKTEESEVVPFYQNPRFFSKDFIEFKVSSDGNPLAIFNVANNTEQFGFPWLRNVFLINNETSKAVGGELDDMFIFRGSNMTVSSCFGQESINTVVIDQSVEGRIQLYGNSTGLNNIIDETLAATVIYANISTIVGRNGSGELIQADCYISLINGKGGSSSTDQDEIIIPNLPCNYTNRMRIVIDKNTRVLNEADNGHFFYAVLDPDSSFSVDCSEKTGGSSYHSFVLGIRTINSVRKFYLNKTESCSVTVETIEGLELTYSLRNSQPCTFPTLLFEEELVEVEFSRIGSIRSTLPSLGNETIDELIKKWFPVATNLNMTISMFNNMTQEMIVINRMALDVLWSSPQHRTHLVGNQVQNLFVIAQGNDSVIPDVQIYSKPNSINVIDLNWLIKPIRENKKRFNSFYLPLLYPMGLNLLIQIESTSTNYPVNITLIEVESFYKNLSFLLDESPMHLELDYLTGDWHMVPTPIPLNNSLTIIDEGSFEENTELIIDHHLGRKHSILYKGNDLIVTNVFNSSSSDDFFLMVFDNFFTNNSIATKNMKNTRIRNMKGGTLPRNVHLNVTGTILILDEVEGKDAEDILEVLLVERQKLDDLVFGFLCKQAGIFPDPNLCQVYHQCIITDEVEFVHYKFTCPTGTVFCEDWQSCGYESTCPCF